MPVQYLDPAIASEGFHAERDVVVDVNDGSGGYQPVVPRPRIPTYEGIRSIEKYFPHLSNRPYQHRPYPAWFYHATKPAMVIADEYYINGEGDRVLKERAAEKAARFGISWGGIQRGFVCTGEWQPQPVQRHGPSPTGTGKALIAPDNKNDQLAAAITAALQKSNVSGGNDQMAAVVAAAVAATMKALGIGVHPEALAGNALAGLSTKDAAEIGASGLPADAERDILIGLAKEKGIKIDGRWSVDRIKQELDKAA